MIDDSMCPCMTWARSGYQKVLTKHHPNCKFYDPEMDAREIISGLLQAMRDWGTDEDGIPDGACEAYNKATLFVAQKPIPWAQTLKAKRRRDWR